MRYKILVMIRFELCANGYQSMINGVVGCADSAELCEALVVGGITPSHGTLFNCQNAARHLPVRVLIRCRPGNYIYSDNEISIMCDDIKMVRDMGYEGVVIGVLNNEGDIDVPAIKKMMAAGEGLKFTFHRAIDACKNPFIALETLVRLGFDKVLTSGCKPTAYEGIEMIRKMQEMFGDSINIMAGGGINEKNVMQIISATGIQHCHASLTSFAPDRHEDLYPKGVDSTGAEMRYLISTVNRVKEFKDVIMNEA